MKTNIETYSIYNEGKSVVAKRFIRTLKNKIFKHMTAISKNVYFDVLDDTVNKYNNTVHRTIKMKPTDVMGYSYAEYNEDFNKKILNSKLVIVLEFQNIKTFLLKDTLQTGWKKFLLLEKLKIQFLGLMLLVNFLLEVFKKELQKTNQGKFRIEKILQRKGDTLYVKWTGYDKSF